MRIPAIEIATNTWYPPRLMYMYFLANQLPFICDPCMLKMHWFTMLWRFQLRSKHRLSVAVLIHVEAGLAEEDVGGDALCVADGVGVLGVWPRPWQLNLGASVPVSQCPPWQRNFLALLDTFSTWCGCTTHMHSMQIHLRYKTQPLDIKITIGCRKWT